MESDLEKLLQEYPELFRVEGGGKIRCRLSGHEMPARLEVVKAYVSGKKFLKLKTAADLNYKELEPLIIPSAKRKHELFCCLTNRFIGKQPAYIQKHMAGQRYRRALEKYNSGELTLFKECGSRAAPQKVTTTVEGEADMSMEGEEPSEEPCSKSGEEVDGSKKPAEHVCMEVETDRTGEEEESRECQGVQRKKQKLKKAKTQKTTSNDGSEGDGGAKLTKLRKTRKTATVVSEAVQAIEPGDDMPNHKRKKMKGNSGVKRAKRTVVS